VWLPDAAALVGWIEQRQEGAEFLVRRVSQDGTRDPSMKVASLAAGRASGYPRIARSANRVILAWVGNGRVETAIAEP
jgi:hypothetical protein